MVKSHPKRILAFLQLCITLDWDYINWYQSLRNDNKQRMNRAFGGRTWWSPRWHAANGRFHDQQIAQLGGNR